MAGRAVLAASLPGQQASPNAIKAMPATRATGMAMPVSSSPNNNHPTSEGTTSNASPVAASLTAARTSTLFIVYFQSFRALDLVAMA